MTTPLIIVDTETTGLDARTGLLLEIGMWAVDPKTLEIVGQFQSALGSNDHLNWANIMIEQAADHGLYLPHYTGPKKNLDGVVTEPKSSSFDEWIWVTHTRNDLLQEVRALSLANLKVSMVEIAAMSWINRVCPNPKAKPLWVGSSLTLDRNFVAAAMPKLYELFHYRSMDVSSFRESWKLWDDRITDSEIEFQTNHRVDVCLGGTLKLLKQQKKIVEAHGTLASMMQPPPKKVTRIIGDVPQA